MTDMIKEVFHFLALLIHPGSTPFLIAFTAVVTIAAVFLVTIAVIKFLAWGEEERFNKSKRFGSVWFHLMGGEKDPVELTKEALEPKAVEAAAKNATLYHKLLYVKVVYLTQNKPGASPVYIRNVERLAESERATPIFDEAVYYTLKRFPAQQPIPPETDSSSGTVDSRLLIPWTDIDMRPFAYRDRHCMEISSEESSDTLYSASHFFNGLQDEAERYFCTYADQDAASLSLVVDFSSIPNAATAISVIDAYLKTNLRNTRLPWKTDGNVYSVRYENAKKGEFLRIDVRFNEWAKLSN